MDWGSGGEGMQDLAKAFVPLRELVVVADVGVSRRRNSHIVLEPTPAESLETMTEFLQGVRNKQRQRFREWQDSVLRVVRPGAREHSDGEPAPAAAAASGASTAAAGPGSLSRLLGFFRRNGWSRAGVGAAGSADTV